MPLKDLALFYDGHLYVLVARTLPHLYAQVPAYFPKEPAFLTAYFPGYPALIRLLALALRDLRWAALAAAWLPAALAVALFYELARGYVETPEAAAAAFLFLPPAWLLCGSLAFVEGLFVCLFLGCVLAHLRERVALACALAAALALTQKSGLLIVPVLLLCEPRRWKRALPCVLAAVVAAAALQAYLGLAFGDPLLNLKAHERIYGGAYFGLPFGALVGGLLSAQSPFRGLFWERKIAIALSALFYAGTFAWALARPREDERPLLAWLGVTLAFYACLTGAPGFFAFPRFMTLAAAPALLLLWRRLPRPSAAWACAAPLALAAALAWTAADAVSSVDLASRFWGPAYYHALAADLRR